MRVWDLATGEELGLPQGYESAVVAVAATPDGRRAVSGSYDGTVRVWDLDTGEELGLLRGHEGYVNAVAVTPDGGRAVSASDDRTVRVWDISTSLDTGLTSGEELAAIALDGAPSAVSVAPDGVSIVTGDAAGNVYCLRYVEPPASK